MKSRPGIFISLIITLAAGAGLLGYSVMRQSQRLQPKVAEQNRVYEQTKIASQSAGLNSNLHITTTDQLQLTTDQSSQDGSIRIYFSNKSDSSSLLSVDRLSSDIMTDEEVAVTELIAGPTTQEQALGAIGGISLIGPSSCDGKDFSVNIDNGTLVLKFCREHLSISKIHDKQEADQLKKTLFGMKNITNVIVQSSDGSCLYELSGLACYR